MSSLSIADLETVETIIRACQTRGAFRAEELLAVGTVYSKVLQILNEEKAKKLRLPSIPEAPTEEAKKPRLPSIPEAPTEEKK